MLFRQQVEIVWFVIVILMTIQYEQSIEIPQYTNSQRNLILELFFKVFRLSLNPNWTTFSINYDRLWGPKTKLNVAAGLDLFMKNYAHILRDRIWNGDDRSHLPPVL